MFLRGPTGLIWSMKKLKCSLSYMKSTMGQVTFFFFVSSLSLAGCNFLPGFDHSGRSGLWFLAFWQRKNYFFLGSSSMSIDSNVSQAIKNSGKISMTKNLVFPDKTVETTLTATKFENGNWKNTTDIWPKHVYFKQQLCDFGIDKQNFPENSVIYISQGYLTIKDKKKLYYVDYYLIGQINECANPPENLEDYVCQDREVKIYRPRYDPVTGNFLGLYETLGYIMVSGDQRSTF